MGVEGLTGASRCHAAGPRPLTGASRQARGFLGGGEASTPQQGMGGQANRAQQGEEPAVNSPPGPPVWKGTLSLLLPLWRRTEFIFEKNK